MRQSLVCCLGTITLPAAAKEASFRHINGQFVGMTDDGTIITATAILSSDGNKLPLGVDGSYVKATAFSYDGTVLAGNRTLPGSQYLRGWYQSSAGNIIDIGTLTGDMPLPRTFSVISGASVNGTVLAGISRNSDDRLQGFRWTLEQGITPIEYRPNATGVSAVAISADGNTIMGTSTMECPECDTSGIFVDCAGDCGPIVAMYQEAFIWTEEDGPVALGTLREPPGTEVVSNVISLGPQTPQSTYAIGISDDGMTVVGYATGYGPFEGFIWQAEKGMQPLPSLAGQSRLFMPGDVSGDGSIVVGGTSGSYKAVDALIWDEQNGTRLLKSVLVDEFGLGDEIGDLRLGYSTYISADGSVIAGYVDGTNGTQTWVVTLPVPEPSTICSVVVLLLTLSLRGDRSRQIAQA